MLELIEGESVKVTMNGRELTARVGYRKPWEKLEALRSESAYWEDDAS